MASVPPQQKETTFTLFNEENAKKNWYQAFSDCRSKGMQLASIENEEKYNKILTKIKSKEHREKLGSYWVSATDHIHSGTFVWMSTGEPVRYANWKSSDSNRSLHAEGTHCMELRNDSDYRMSDEICSRVNSYICEDITSDLPTRNAEIPFKEYTFFTGNKLSWYAALADCEAQGLRLATNVDLQEHLELVEIIKADVTADPMSFWVAGSNLGRTNNRTDFVWMTTGQPVDHSWHPSEPNFQTYNIGANRTETEHCMSMKEDNDYLWSDHICSERYYYICENRS